jgi:hypothetical protein
MQGRRFGAAFLWATFAGASVDFRRKKEMGGWWRVGASHRGVARLTLVALIAGLAVISAAGVYALQGAPAAFKEWQRRMMRKALDLSVKGWRVESVELDPDEFRRDCDLTRSLHNLDSLDNFAFKVAQRKED